MTARWRQPGVLLPAVAALSAGSVLVALGTQHLLDMQPCPWCVLQRLIALVLALLAGLGWGAHRLRLHVLRNAAAAGAGLMALCGMAAALWQHFVAAQSASCAMTFADRLMTATGLDFLAPWLFAAYASCADAKTVLLSLPYEFWSLAMFALCLGACWLVLRPARRNVHSPF